MITSQLYFELTKCFSPYQHGFLPGKSTITNLLLFTSDIFANFHSMLQTDVIYTDFSKAFDVVNHRLLLLKLKLIGFPDIFIRWIRSYLCGRTQKVVYNSCFSETISVTSGVPQGSHLGPLLFLIFINDLPTVIENCSILLYADDVKIYHASNENDNILQNNLNNIANWCSYNCLYLNLAKCKHMIFARKVWYRRVFCINGMNLETVEQFPDLGVLMDPKLRFNLHINSILSKAYRTLGFIKRWAKEFRDPYITKLLFTSLVRPILEYASIVWNPSYLCDINRIESVQKQFLLFCLRHLGWGSDVRLPPYESRLKLIRLPTMQIRRKMLNTTFIINLLTGRIDCPPLLNKIQIKINVNTFTRTTRQSYHHSLLNVQYHRQNFMNFQPFRVACMQFNELYSLFDFNISLLAMKSRIIDKLCNNNSLL